ncbi:hypothetical protein BJV82DRAFT_78381 [Fennellomyces sp. T-0311]|nr:hypothetical protein BJV82DRAFT_78381 [Fennellomyces sp. T-0311]
MMSKSRNEGVAKKRELPPIKFFFRVRGIGKLLCTSPLPWQPRLATDQPTDGRSNNLPVSSSAHPAGALSKLIYILNIYAHLMHELCRRDQAITRKTQVGHWTLSVVDRITYRSEEDHIKKSSDKYGMMVQTRDIPILATDLFVAHSPLNL